MTRIAKHLVLQDIEGDAVLLDESAGTEIVIPHAALEPLADAARYFSTKTADSPVPKCSLCGRERTLGDAYDYNPIQAMTGRPLGWYSGDDGEVCPECMTKTLRGVDHG